MQALTLDAECMVLGGVEEMEEYNGKIIATDLLGSRETFSSKILRKISSGPHYL